MMAKEAAIFRRMRGKFGLIMKDKLRFDRWWFLQEPSRCFGKHLGVSLATPKNLGPRLLQTIDSASFIRLYRGTRNKSACLPEKWREKRDCFAVRRPILRTSPCVFLCDVFLVPAVPTWHGNPEIELEWEGGNAHHPIMLECHQYRPNVKRKQQ
jgi:hypothetical protein